MAGADTERERTLAGYVARWGPLTAREVAAAFLLDAAQTRRDLDRLRDRGAIRLAGHDAHGEPLYTGP